MGVTPMYEGMRLSYRNGVGGFVQKYQVELDIDPATYDDPSDLIAETVLQSGISYTDPHPTQAGLFAAGFDAWPFIETNGSTSKTIGVLQVTWSTPSFIPFGGVKIEIAGSTAQHILNRWPNGPLIGQAILVGFNKDRTRVFPLQNDPVAVKQQEIGLLPTNGDKFDSVNINIDSPNSLLKLTRTEFHYPDVAMAVRRRLNSRTFLKFAPQTVLLRNINAVNMVGLGTIIPNYFTVEYLFEIVNDPAEWIRCEFFRDQFTNKPPIGIDITDGTNNGYAFVNPYGEPLDYTVLGFNKDLLNI